MGEIQVPFRTCDLPGCRAKWPTEELNGNLEVIFGVHPQIFKNWDEPVILQKISFHFCPSHAEEIKRPLGVASNFLGGVVGSDLKSGFGCWITMWHWHGGIIQQVLNHQFPYDLFVTIYSSFKREFFTL